MVTPGPAPRAMLCEPESRQLRPCENPVAAKEKKNENVCEYEEKKIR
jgi:hypothetical protein